MKRAREDEERDSQPSLLDIPWHDVLFTQVFPNLSLKDIFHLRQVSSEMKRAVSEYFKVNKRVDLSDINSAFNEKAFAILTDEATGIRSLILTDCKWLSNASLKSVVNKNRNIVDFDISGCSAVANESLLVLARNAEHLQSLCLKNCHWVSAEALKSIVSHCENLECVDLTSCWEVDDEAVVQLASHNSRITKLSLARIYGITDKSLSTVAHKCRELQNLNVSGCWRITDWGIRLIGEYCRNLGNLKVEDCSNVTEKSLIILRLQKKHVEPFLNSNPFAISIPVPRLQM